MPKTVNWQYEKNLSLPLNILSVNLYIFRNNGQQNIPFLFLRRDEMILAQAGGQHHYSVTTGGGGIMCYEPEITWQFPSVPCSYTVLFIIISWMFKDLCWENLRVRWLQFYHRVMKLCSVSNLWREALSAPAWLSGSHGSANQLGKPR